MLTISLNPFLIIHASETFALLMVTDSSIADVLALGGDTTFVTVTFEELGGGSRGHSQVIEIIKSI